MSTCPICGYENAFGTLSCTRCFSLLRELGDEQRKRSTDTVDIPAEDIRSRRQGSRHTAVLGADSVALFIGDCDEPLIFQITNQAILGRYTPHSSTQPRIDLTPYGAYEKGISRIHAIIRRAVDGLMVEDLASSNGTWLNSEKLYPYVPARLRSGDRLRLGKIDIEIQFNHATGRAATGPLSEPPHLN